MKKIFLIILLVLLFLAFTPNFIQAAGLVPCGGEGELPCQLCHFFVLFNNIIKFLLIPCALNKGAALVPLIAALMIAIGGFMYMIAYVGGIEKGPEMTSQAKRLFTAVAIGLLIIYGAFIIIGTFLWFIGLADWTTDIYHRWWEEGIFEIPCP